MTILRPTPVLRRALPGSSEGWAGSEDASAWLRPLLAADVRPLMMAVGPLVDSLYEHGAEKLLRRLEDARDGYAAAHVITDGPGGPPVALAAETGKGARARKLSTFWVAEDFRRRGHGTQLLANRVQAWACAGIDTANVTVREDRALQLERVFLPLGFERTLVVHDRYGSERNEVVLSWRADSLHPALDEAPSTTVSRSTRSTRPSAA